jgi:myo-inositol 2-dehydrogenase/D-chiro-inositol 1-dehydrogenase
MLRAENVVPSSVERLDAAGGRTDSPWPGFQSRYAAAYAAELDSFIRSVERGEPPEVGPRDGRAVLLLAEAALQSSRTGKPVRLGRTIGKRASP